MVRFRLYDRYGVAKKIINRLRLPRAPLFEIRLRRIVTAFHKRRVSSAVSGSVNISGSQRVRYRLPVGGEQVLGDRVAVSVTLKEEIRAFISQASNLT